MRVIAGLFGRKVGPTGFWAKATQGLHLELIRWGRESIKVKIRFW